MKYCVIKEPFFNEVGGVQCLLGMLGTRRSQAIIRGAQSPNHRHKTRALRGTTLLSLPAFMSSRINCLRDCCDVLRYDSNNETLKSATFLLFAFYSPPDYNILFY